MKEFLTILFFAKTMLITSEPINLIGEIELVLNEPIKAVTTGASIQIDVSSLVSWKQEEKLSVLYKRLETLFPSGSVRARLIDKNNNEIVLIYTSNYLVNRQNILLTLDRVEGVPTGIEYHKLYIISDIELKGVKVIWKNYKH